MVLLVIQFRPAIRAIIESARSRKFTLKIGGQELTMDEANHVQQQLIADLQKQVSEIQKKLGTPDSAGELGHGAELTRPLSLLWVDDNPKNNSYFVQQLEDQGVKVDTAVSTADGAARLISHKYDYVISDMGRLENGVYNPTAGLDLLELVRRTEAQIPFVAFSTSHAVKTFERQARELGASAMTSPPTQLFGILNLAK